MNTLLSKIIKRYSQGVWSRMLTAHIYAQPSEDSYEDHGTSTPRRLLLFATLMHSDKSTTQNSVPATTRSVGLQRHTSFEIEDIERYHPPLFGTQTHSFYFSHDIKSKGKDIKPAREAPALPHGKCSETATQRHQAKTQIAARSTHWSRAQA